MSLAVLLDRRVLLQRPAVSADASGGTLRAFTTIASHVPAALSPASASIVSDYARRDMIVDYQLYTTFNLDAAPINGVRLGDRFADGSDYYLVKAVKKSANAQISGEVLFQCDCEKRSE